MMTPKSFNSHFKKKYPKSKKKNRKKKSAFVISVLLYVAAVTVSLAVQDISALQG